MRAQPNRSEDKQYLRMLTRALDVSESRIKLDECGDWNIVGVRGHISTETEFWYLYTSCETDKKWTYTKKKLSFMEVHIDGDSEGVMKLSRMPFRDEAQTVRKVIGLRPRSKLTEEGLAQLKIRFKSSSQEGVYSENTAVKQSGSYPTSLDE